MAVSAALGGGGVDDQHALAALLIAVAGNPLRQFASRQGAHSFKGFGQLARQCHQAGFAQRGGDVGGAFGHPVRRFVQHHGIMCIAPAFQLLATRAALGRQKP